VLALLAQHLVDDDGTDGRMLNGLLLLLSIEMRMRRLVGTVGWLRNIALTRWPSKVPPLSLSGLRIGVGAAANVA
jgi:hypothetical protein